MPDDVQTIFIETFIFLRKTTPFIITFSWRCRAYPGPIQDVIKEHCLQSESTTFIGDKTKGMLQGQDSKTSSKDDCAGKEDWSNLLKVKGNIERRRV